jgi:hypothetical protein
VTRLEMFFACLLLAACPLLRQESDLVADWRRTIASLPQDPYEAAAALNAAYGRAGIPLTYWMKQEIADTLRESPPDLAWFEHPCGPTALVQAPTIPAPDNRLDSEYAVELDSTGRELRRWPLPIDHFPIGIVDNRLIINLHLGTRHDVGLVVAHTGEYAVRPFAWPPMKVVPCPPYEGFGDSAYFRCVQVLDEKGSHRVIGYQGPCT